MFPNTKQEGDVYLKTYLKI